MRTAAEVLTSAREKIKNPEHWTTEYVARNAAGEGVRAHDPTACQWCALGALEVAAGRVQITPERDGVNPLYYDAEAVLDSCALTLAPDLDEDGDEPLAARLNDRGNHAKVLAMFDCAIAKASA